MTKEEAKKRAELYSALAEGKIIQVLSCKGEWIDIKTDELDYLKNYYKYRIKPEPRYRPFKTQEECWNEMLKHQPFGWLKEKANKKEMAHIGRIFDVPNDTLITLSINEGHNLSSNYFFLTYTFADGAPFGIKEELFMEEIEMWLARNKSNILWLFIGEKPKKEKNRWFNTSNHCQIMYSNLFPEVQWSDDEPTKVKLVIEK